MCRYVSIGHYPSNTLLQPSFSGAEPGLCSIAAGSAGNSHIVYIGDRNPEQGTCQVSQSSSAELPSPILQPQTNLTGAQIELNSSWCSC